MLPIQHYFPQADALVYGCMGLGGSWDHPTTSKEQRDLSYTAIEAALEASIRFFDHADIYTRGKAEAVFGEYLRRRIQVYVTNLLLQTKCAIRFADATTVGRYDFSKSYIVGFSAPVVKTTANRLYRYFIAAQTGSTDAD